MKLFFHLHAGAAFAPAIAVACLTLTAQSQQRAPLPPASQDSEAAPGAALPPTAIRSQPGLDHSRMYYDAPGDGALWALGEHYKARFDAEGATFFAGFGKLQTRNLAHALSPDAVSVGGQPVAFERSASATRSADRVDIDRGAFVERYELAPQSVEQVFVFPSLPRSGDLVIHLPVASEMPAVETEAGLEFRDDAGRVVYGRATAIDARGRRASAATHLDGGSITIQVDASFLATAAMPLVIDPIITHFAVASQALEDFSPDVAWDSYNGVWLAVYEQTFSATDTDVYAKEYTSTGTLIASATVDFTSVAWASPRVADNAAGHLFLVVAETTSTSPHAIMGRTVQPNGTIITMSSQFDIGTNIAGNKVAPSVGGDPYPSLPSYFLVAWEHDIASSNSEIGFRRVAPDTTMSTPVYLPTGGGLSYDVTPSVSKSDDSAAWLLAWERVETLTRGDIWATHVNWDGGLLDGPFGVTSGSPAFDFSPCASSPIYNSPRSAIAFTRRVTPGGNADIWVAVIDGPGAASITNMTGLENSGNLAVDQLEPSIDSDGQHFLVSYSEYDPNFSNWSIFVSDLYLADTQIGISESHVQMQTINYDRHSRISAAHDQTSTSRRCFVIYDTDTNSTQYADVEGVIFDLLQGGSTSAFCFGDGSGTACPCANSGSSGHGCANSVNSAGALLTVTGAPSTLNDSIVLHASGMPATANCTFFQGTAANASTVFGDGLRCAGGTVIRLRSTTASGGSATFPGNGDPHVSSQGLVSQNGGLRTYQVSYRNADPAFCTSATFNISNGVIVNWAR